MPSRRTPRSARSATRCATSSGSIRAARSSRPGSIPALDGFRAYAILAVVLLHLLGASGALEGQAGTPFATVVWGLAGNVLDIFFILSGFLLFLPVATRGGMGDLADYATGRAARLLPAYWLAVAISLAIVVASSTFASPPAANALVHVATLQMPARMLDPQMGIGFGLNGPLWMISIIAGFYVVLALVARPYLRHPLLGLVLAAAITIGWKLVVTGSPELFVDLASGSEPAWVMELLAIDQIPAWAFSFALGMTGAWAYVRYRPSLEGPRVRRAASSVAPVAALGFAFCAYLYGRDAAAINAAFAGAEAREDVLLGIAYTTARAALMAAIVIGPLWLQRPFSSRPVRKLSDLSYGLYLIHLPVSYVLCVALLELPSDGSPAVVAAWIALVVGASLTYAQLTRTYLERPIIGWARGRRSAAQAADAAMTTSEQPAAGRSASMRASPRP